MSTAAATQGPVEARSLSSITTIASNPPAYPRNPTHEKLDPLVLYIVRVPGSQAVLTGARVAHLTDIFLSPVKPPTKSSVSAEAINASLYYLHVATPEDDALLQEVKLEREEEAQRRREALEAAGEEDPAQRDFARMNKVRRKPVGGGESATQDPTGGLAHDNAPPSVASPTVPRRPVPMPQVSAENMSFAGTPVANVQPSPINESGRPPVESMPQSPVPRRPLPPLPPSEEPWNGRLADEEQPGKNSRWSAFAGHDLGHGLDSWKERFESLAAGRHSLDSNRPHLPPRPTQDRAGSPPSSPGRPSSHHQGPHYSPRRDTGFHITLIRRDPASGTQWNVATISTPRMDRNAVDIEISTPGYNRFTGSNETLSLASVAANLPPGLIRTAGAAMPPSIPTEQPSEQPTGPRKFQRQLCVSKPFDDSAAGGGRSSSDFGNEGFSSKLKSGYYVFSSPWNGTCTFASSVNGRSLKCKHMISGPSGQVPVHGEDPNPAVTVAEIRFNTPFQAANLHYHAAQRSHPHQHQHHPVQPSHNTNDSSTTDAASKRNSLSQLLNPNNYARPRAHSGPNSQSPITPDSPRPNFHPNTLLRRTSLRAGRFTRQNHFTNPHSHRRRSTSTSSGGPDSDEDRLDLSLAHERAGGGMRGKSAKLGKLIIEDEGIKMLDLVVAACMAVWWRGYYH
ncbi:uncharacterized protein N7459_009951 [Penicillium hispanicum]|uniref:uncharacterized protein n=1 Tax=Penicillium hispanicum TaxID=1080232 RepID=UPI0025416FE5|nr:uncharacterized protein N7459_009951 [Penicillium hispanicum]KAJ5570521.1 hypothetical protein N7459_009951 [Penicillium hispanicum]